HDPGSQGSADRCADRNDDRAERADARRSRRSGARPPDLLAAADDGNMPGGLSIGVAALAGDLLMAAALVVFRRASAFTILIAADGGQPADVIGLMASRLQDAATHRLAARLGDRFELTAAGRLIVGCATAADRVLGRAR